MHYIRAIPKKVVISCWQCNTRMVRWQEQSTSGKGPLQAPGEASNPLRGYFRKDERNFIYWYSIKFCSAYWGER